MTELLFSTKLIIDNNENEPMKIEPYIVAEARSLAETENDLGVFPISLTQVPDLYVAIENDKTIQPMYAFKLNETVYIIGCRVE